MKKPWESWIEKISSSLYKQIKLLVIILILVIFGNYIINVYYMMSSSCENVKAVNESMLQKIQDEIEMFAGTLNSISSALIYSPPVYDFFTMDDTERVVVEDDITTVVSNMNLLEEDIKRICLYDSEMKLIEGEEESWQKGILDLKNTKKIQFSNLYIQEKNGLGYYLFSCPVYDLMNKEYGIQMGTVVFVMRTGQFEEILREANVTKNSQIYLMDGNEQVIASRRNADNTIWDAKKIGNKSRYYVEEKETFVDGWKIVSIIPRQELYLESASRIINITITYLIVPLLIIVMLWFVMKRAIIPLGQIDTFIKKIVSEPEARLETDRKDEIGIVMRSLNQMLDENEDLYNSVQQSQKKMYETELAKRKFQVLAYRNQINPHFLYNTFDCIKAMAVYYDADEIAEITMSLSHVFRYAVKGDNIVLVKEEIQNIKEYAQIIKHRFAGRIRIHILVDEEVKKKPMIKLLLQPLIENAVFHGVEKRVDAGDVFVTIERTEQEKLRFCVEDNGCGMDEEKKQSVLRMMKAEKSVEGSNGIGLVNIYSRLKMFYGETAIMTIESSPQVGTKVMIIVPEQLKGE